MEFESKPTFFVTRYGTVVKLCELFRNNLKVKVKVKQSRYVPGSDPEGSRKLRFPDFMTTAQDVNKVVSPRHRPPLPPENTPATHFCYRMSRPQGHSAIGRILYE